MAGRSSEPGLGVTERVLRLLGAFDDKHVDLTLAELARRSRLPMTTAHRLVADLLRGEALERRPDGRLVVGRRLWQVGLLAPVQRELREVALPHLQDLYDATRENVHLAVREGTEALYVERVHGRNSVPLVSRAGGRLPMHATGVGKVVLAHAPADVVAKVVAEAGRVTPFTITDPARLHRELAAIRRRGYARTVEEMTLGTCSVAVPVTGPDGEVVAAVGLVTTTRHSPDRYVPALLVAAAGIARGLRVVAA